MAEIDPENLEKSEKLRIFQFCFCLCQLKQMILTAEKVLMLQLFGHFWNVSIEFILLMKNKLFSKILDFQVKLLISRI